MRNGVSCNEVDKKVDKEVDKEMEDDKEVELKMMVMVTKTILTI